MSYPKVDPLFTFDKAIYTFTLYEVMVDHSGLGIGAPVNCGFAIDKKGELGLNV